MNKEYYKSCIKDIINELINKKDLLCGDIDNIAAYIDFQSENNDLSKIDIIHINEKRNNMGAIYKLIEDLERLERSIKKT